MLTLTEGKSSIVVVPEYGAGLLGWLHGGTAVLRRALPQAAMGDFHALSCFPLLPYANRIAGGRFTWDGHDHILTRNFGDRPHTIHGIGRQRAWTVAHVHPNAVSLELTHEADAAWPFAFLATMAYTLNGPTLSVDLTLTNRHTAAAPAGLGIHPYFPKPQGVTLRFEAPGAWENGPDTLPLRHGPVPPDWSFSPARPVASVQLDNCFTGWTRSADINAGRASLRIEASEVFANLQVFTPPSGDFFCVEPVTHSPDAINRPGLPAEQAMASLQAGATLSGTIRLTLTRPDA